MPTLLHKPALQFLQFNLASYLAVFRWGAQLCPVGPRHRSCSSLSAMGVKRVEDLVAFQQAVAFKREVCLIVTKHPRAERSFRYRDQLFDAASGVESNIAEGWRRSSTPDMIRVLSLRDVLARRSTREIVGWRGPWVLQL